MRNFTNFSEFCAHLSKLITKRTPHAGRNVTLEDTPDGFRIHCDPPTAPTGTGNAAYTGMYEVTLYDGKLSISGGWLLRNGEMTEVADGKGITPTAGYLCVYSTIKSDAWTVPEYRIIEKPAPDAYPVAKIEIDEKTKAVSIKQYYVVVAVIMLARACPQIEV